MTKPKYKVGDIIRHTEYSEYTYEVKEVNPPYYTLYSIKIKKIISPVYFASVDEKSRLDTKLDRILK